MTTVDVSATVARAARGSTAVSVLRLARTEARRILLHPAHLPLALIALALCGIPVPGLPEIQARTDIKDGLEYVFLLWYWLLVFFAANLVACGARRCGADSQLDATPVSGQARTLAVLLGVGGPVVFAGLVAAGIYALTYGGGTDLEGALTPAELAVLPLGALGAGLMGVATARWLPWPGAPLGVMVVLVVWVGANPGGAWWAPWSASPTFLDDPVLLGGSQAWHAGYLLGVAMLAGLAALLRHRPHRRALLAASALVGAATLAAGILQLP